MPPAPIQLARPAHRRPRLHAARARRRRARRSAGRRDHAKHAERAIGASERLRSTSSRPLARRRASAARTHRARHWAARPSDARARGLCSWRRSDDADPKTRRNAAIALGHAPGDGVEQALLDAWETGRPRRRCVGRWPRRSERWAARGRSPCCATRRRRTSDAEMARIAARSVLMLERTASRAERGTPRRRALAGAPVAGRRARAPRARGSARRRARRRRRRASRRARRRRGSRARDLVGPMRRAVRRANDAVVPVPAAEPSGCPTASDRRGRDRARGDERRGARRLRDVDGRCRPLPHRVGGGRPPARAHVGRSRAPSRRARRSS